MSGMRNVLLLGLLCLAPGCVLRTGHGPYYPRPAPQPAPRPRPMSYDEAVSLGLGQCRSRGYQCELQEAHMTGNDVWKVKFRAFASGGGKGHLHIDYDAYSRAILKLDDKVKGGRDWDDDDDDDDDHGHGHGHGKKKGHGKWDD
jgi:hypothetical protein